MKKILVTNDDFTAFEHAIELLREIVQSGDGTPTAVEALVALRSLMPQLELGEPVDHS